MCGKTYFTAGFKDDPIKYYVTPYWGRENKNHDQVENWVNEYILIKWVVVKIRDIILWNQI